MLNYNELEKKIGYSFSDRELLITALTHKSFAQKSDKKINNERLEFLGDSILGFCVAEYLFENYKELPEGQLTKIRSLVVCENALYKIANEIELGKYLRLGWGEEQSNGRNRPSILSDAMEALFAAIYLDGGSDAARNVIISLLKNDIENVIKYEDYRDFKTLLQEITQKDNGKSPVYELIKEEGPDHDKIFTVSVSLDGRVLAKGAGHSKKEAEKTAAKRAVAILNDDKKS